MRQHVTAADIVTGVIGGIVATRVTDYVQKKLWQATPDDEKAREPETPDGSSAEAAARKLLEHIEDDAPEPQRRAVRNGLHYGLGAAWGPLYCWLRRHTEMSPAAAGVSSGLALSLVVDEALNSLLRITPPPRAYPASAHVRGLATHITWGLVCGAVAEPLRARWRRRTERSLPRDERR